MVVCASPYFDHDTFTHHALHRMPLQLDLIDQLN